ncbi:MAG: DUF3606 domain-containing protein [Salinimicrobium sp.]
MNDRGNTDPSKIGHGKDRQYWAEKWGITEKRLSEAIEQTNSEEVEQVEEYLRSHKYI